MLAAPNLEAETIHVGQQRGWMSTVQTEGGYRVEVHVDGRKGVLCIVCGSDRDATRRGALRFAEEKLSSSTEETRV